MRQIVLISAALLAFTISASADSIPTYNLTQGTIFVSVASDPQQVLVDYSFSGGGVTFSGTSTNTNSCFFVVAGDACFPGGVTYRFEDTDISFAVINGTFYAPLYTIGGVGFGGAPITLPDPTPSGTFTVTVPVIFSGTFGACVADVQNGICLSNVPGMFSVNGKGSGTLVFTTDFANNGFPIWNFASATYTLNPVPEPASITLIGTGALAIAGRSLRRKF
jgi:PEP-CTERM motif